MVPSAGSLLAKKYRVIAAIGQGAMGSVFRAENIVTGKQVALKWMRPHIAQNPDAAARLLREAQAASRLRHANVVDVYDIIHDDGTLFLVMELLQGETLRTYLQRNRQAKIPEFIALLLPAIDGVAAAHAAGVIHRDLKPDNIFLELTEGAPFPSAKVVDFGVAKLTDSEGLALTGTGLAIGTPMYMSLEQLRGDKDIDARTDIYAFGVMLYEAIAGHVPYQATTLSELAIKVLTTEPVPLKELRPDVPTALARLVDWALAKDRDRRLPSARALLQELEPFAREFSFRQEMTNPDAATPLVAAGVGAVGRSTDAPAALRREAAAAQRVSAPRRAERHVEPVANPHFAAASDHSSGGALSTRHPESPQGGTRTRARGFLLVALATCALVALVWTRAAAPPAATPRTKDVHGPKSNESAQPPTLATALVAEGGASVPGVADAQPAAEAVGVPARSDAAVPPLAASPSHPESPAVPSPKTSAPPRVAKPSVAKLPPDTPAAKPANRKSARDLLAF